MKKLILLLYITTPALAQEMKCEKLTGSWHETPTIYKCEDDFVICYINNEVYKGGIYCIKKEQKQNE